MLISKCVTGDVERAGRLNEELSKNALRMIALAYKEIDTVPETPKPEDTESV